MAYDAGLVCALMGLRFVEGAGRAFVGLPTAGGEDTNLPVVASTGAGALLRLDESVAALVAEPASADAPTPPAWPAGARPLVPSYGLVERAVEAGLPRQALANLAHALWPDEHDAARWIYELVPKTSFFRRPVLTLDQSERTERVARLLAQAERVFGDAEDAREFLRRPHPELEGRSPLDAARTELGARRVETILDSIDLGLPV